MLKVLMTTILLLSSTSYASAEVTIAGAGALGGIVFCDQTADEIKGLQSALVSEQALKDNIRALPADSEKANWFSKYLARIEQSIKTWRDGLNSNPAAIVTVNLNTSMKISNKALFADETRAPTVKITPINAQDATFTEVGPGQVRIQYYRVGFCHHLKEAGGDFNAASANATKSLFAPAK